MLLRLIALLAVAAPALAQGLSIHDADRQARDGWVERAMPDGEAVWIGPVRLALPAGAVQTVGLEVDSQGGTMLSLWLAPEPAAAFADLTAASVGRPIAVVHRGRVLAAPVVQERIANGLVMISGLSADEGRVLADAFREADVAPQPLPPQTPPRLDPVPAEPPPALDPIPAEQAPVLDPAPAVAPSAADAAALAFSDAVVRRDWPAAADALHADAQASVRETTLGLVRLDGPTVRVRDGLREATFQTVDALGRTPGGTADALSDRDLAVLYFAALDALGDWPPGAARRVIGRVADGAHVHVLLRAEAVTGGVADVSVVTVARDGQGRWRALLTEARGF